MELNLGRDRRATRPGRREVFNRSRMELKRGLRALLADAPREVFNRTRMELKHRLTASSAHSAPSEVFNRTRMELKLNDDTRCAAVRLRVRLLIEPRWN